MIIVIVSYSPEREEPGPVEERPEGPVHHLAVHGVGGGGEVAVAGREGEALVQRHRQPHRLEALGGEPLHVRVGEGALQVLGPAQVPPHRAEVLRGLLEPFEHVLTAQTEHIVLNTTFMLGK